MADAALVKLTAEPIDIAGIQDSVRDLSRGGVVTFIGEVRSITESRITERLFYEAHAAMAEAQMRKIATEEASRFDAAVAIVHRIGELRPGDTAVVCVAACAHRSAAFDCCRNLIERVKRDVPIWKKEFGPEGEEWT